MTTHSGYTRQSGITLIEIMVTVAILAILMSAAAPAFRAMIASSSASSAANDILSSLILARSEAVKRGVVITVQATNNNWIEGWQVSAGANPPLASGAALADDLNFAADSVTLINFAPDGTANTGNLTIRSTASGACRRVEILGSGKALIADCP